MHRNIIIITGTPGTGKTTIAIALSKRINAKLIAVNDLIKHKKLYMGYSDDGAMMAKLPELKWEILREIAREKKQNRYLGRTPSIGYQYKRCMCHSYEGASQNTPFQIEKKGISCI